ncbi:MAG: cohesin domain-containing protein [Candidatus Falkowbacteria bacterium]|nr:cohesin domain-containing protein [Candidatus Falkowbacteria bacterium]
MRFYSVIFLSILFLFTSAQKVHAADISFEADKKVLSLGDETEVFVFIDTKLDTINALEGIVNYPKDLLAIKKIRTGNSLVNLWVNAPAVKEDGVINFSGITPGGYKGTRGFIFSIFFKTLAEGNGSVDSKDLTLLKNDGLGTKVSGTISALNFTIKESAKKTLQKIEINDQIPPEIFSPTIASSSEIFDNKNVIIFATQDKNSGIDHYEIKEFKQKLLSLFAKWQIATSPYQLEDQQLESYIYIKAFDKAGNTKTIKLSPTHSVDWYERHKSWVIIMITIMLIFGIIKLHAKYLK